MNFQVQVNQVAYVNRALGRVSADIANGTRQEMTAIGKLVEVDVERLALSRISGISRSVAWADMRVGQNTKLVYVVPKKKGTKIASKKRKNLAPLMQSRALAPARAKNDPEIVRRTEAMVARVTAEFNGGRG